VAVRAKAAVELALAAYAQDGRTYPAKHSARQILIQNGHDASRNGFSGCIDPYIA
jgi:hypothetical protein